MSAWFSYICIGLAQVAAVLLFFLYEEPDAFRRRPVRLELTAAFALVNIVVQARLRQHLDTLGWGSLPVLQFLAGTWCYYILFIRFWGRLKWLVCGYVALLILLIDNSVWPLLSSLSRMTWGISYLYEGSLWLRIPYIFVFAVLECALIYITRRLLPEMPRLHLDRYNVILTVVSVIPFVYMRFVFSRLADQNNKMTQSVMTLCCLVAIITAVSGVGRSSEQYEELKEARMRYVLKSQQQLFEQKLNDIDAVNRRYHDMKNILLYLKANGNSGEMDESIELLLQEIRPYENKVETGHQVVDVILSEKLKVCQENEITCVPYIDGSRLSFVKPLDLCAIFGNAMDNAIESCVQIPETGRRQIGIHLLSRGNSAILTFRNTYGEAPVLRGDLPVTTKEDSQNHGYGLRNIRHIAEQYGGTVHCRVEGEEFILTVLLQTE